MQIDGSGRSWKTIARHGTPRTALAHPMILQNGPKTESRDSGIVALSKHSSEQTQKIPELLLHKTKKSLHVSEMAEALHKMQKKKIGDCGRGTGHVICQSGSLTPMTFS